MAPAGTGDKLFLGPGASLAPHNSPLPTALRNMVGKARGALSPLGGEFLEARVGLGVHGRRWAMLRIVPLWGSGTPPVGRLPSLRAFPDLDVPATGWEGVCANVCGRGEPLSCVGGRARPVPRAGKR